MYDSTYSEIEHSSVTKTSCLDWAVIFLTNRGVVKKAIGDKSSVDSTRSDDIVRQCFTCGFGNCLCKTIKLNLHNNIIYHNCT